MSFLSVNDTIYMYETLTSLIAADDN